MSPQPSEPAVVPLSGTPLAPASLISPSGDVDASFVLMALVYSLAGEVMSPDAWELAFLNTQRYCELAGVDPLFVDFIIEQARVRITERRRKNPMSCMF